MTVPVEPNADDVKFDTWARRLRVIGGVVITVFLAGATFVIWAESTFVKRVEFEGHSAAQQALEAHAADDARSYVQKSEFQEHVLQPGHPATQRINERQDSRIRELERNQTWIAGALYAIARRNGIQLPPPPLTGSMKEE
jgi:preprotein translocase subunit SecF